MKYIPHPPWLCNVLLKLNDPTFWLQRGWIYSVRQCNSKGHRSFAWSESMFWLIETLEDRLSVSLVLWCCPLGRNGHRQRNKLISVSNQDPKEWISKSPSSTPVNISVFTSVCIQSWYLLVQHPHVSHLSLVVIMQSPQLLAGLLHVVVLPDQLDVVLSHRLQLVFQLGVLARQTAV